MAQRSEARQEKGGAPTVSLKVEIAYKMVMNQVSSDDKTSSSGLILS